MPYVPLHSDALRLGLYIKIEGSWFSHPFPTNTFKITTAKDLFTLQGLTKIKLYFDPDRSDLEWGQSGPIEAPVCEPMQDLEVADQGSSDEFSLLESPSKEEEKAPEDLIQRKVAQHQAFHTYQDHLQKVGGQLPRGRSGS